MRIDDYAKWLRTLVSEAVVQNLSLIHIFNTEGAKLAEEVMNNELTARTQAAQNGNIGYLTATVWYRAEGGITALDVMLQELEAALLK